MLEKTCKLIGYVSRWVVIMTIYSVIGYIFIDTLYHYIFIGY